MKKFLFSALLALTALPAAVSAETYSFDASVGNWSSLTGLNQLNTAATTLTLTYNGLASNSTFTGHLVALNGNIYDITATLTGAYTAGALTKWADFVGTYKLNGGATMTLHDVVRTADAYDAAFGINAAPNNASGTTAEFGWWAGGVYSSPTATSYTTKLDMDLGVKCSSATPLSNKLCPAGSSSSGGTVPLPGTLALLGLGVLGLGLRRMRS